MSIHGTYDKDNIFRKILSGDAPCVKVFEDSDVLAFIDIFPESYGHVLVIPKFEARNFFDLPSDHLAVLTQRVRLVGEAVLKALKPDGIRIMQYNGTAATQTVFHVHFHIVPCYAGTVLTEHNTMQAEQEILEACAEKIRRELQ